MRFLATICAISLVGFMSAASDEPLVAVQTISMPGVEGRIDHMAVDLKAERLYVAALGNGSVEVIDLAAGKRTTSIASLQEPQGVRVIPQSGVVVVGCGGDGSARFYDVSLKPFGALHNLDDADNVRYDAAANRIYVGYGGGALAAIDPAAPSISKTIDLTGHPESFQLETSGDRIFINVPAAKEVTVANRRSGEILARWKISEARSNFPMALDEKNHRLFIGCREPAKLLVLDTETGATCASFGCVGDTDDVFYDADRARIYVTGGEGSVSVFSQTDADHYAHLATVATAPGARTALFVPETKRLYVAVPHRGNQPAEIRVFDVR